MSRDAVALWIVIAAIPAINLYGALFALGGPWWKSLVGRAHFAMTWGLLLLIDFAVYYAVTGGATPRNVRLAVFSLITLGCWMSLIALLWERRRNNNNGNRRSSYPEDSAFGEDRTG